MKKKCGACGTVKSCEEFYKDRSRLGGYSYRCKKCDYLKNKGKPYSKLWNKRNWDKKRLLSN